ncbi:MAG TPA: alpha/beta fold hydrolase [Acidimicrobiales bacterium]|nr:alpha/beta fold hydrolase [Acidimicrobiales bacterium]
MRRTAATLLALVAVTLVAPDPAAGTPGTQDPPLGVDPDALQASLECTTPFDDTREPVLLVHGTFATGNDNWSWNYLPHLTAQGFDVCTVTMPARSTGDIQIAAEYVVHAIRRMVEMGGGRSVDVLGHSQGGLQPRWVTRWYPETRALVDDLVTLAAPHNGTAAASFQDASCAACFQMAPDSAFITALNSDDPTPGEVDHTSIWTDAFDELVHPQPQASTLAGGGENVANLSIQAVCSPVPKAVDHVSIAIDTAARDLVLDAFTQEGPADPTRAEPDCVTPFYLSQEEFEGGRAMFEDFLTDPTVPEGGFAEEEPPTAYYADPERPAFDDVPETHGAYWEVTWAAHRGIASGNGDLFRPGAAWTRAQATMWLWRLAGSPPGAPDTDFGDVPAGAWYHDGLDWAVSEGIVSGYRNGNFGPGRIVTRAQLAWWLWAYADQPAATTDHPFVDVPDGAWYESGLDWLAEEGIVNGFAGNRYRPTWASSRAGVARMLHRLDAITTT